MVSIYLNDDRDYSEVIEGWVRDFVCTMNENIHDGGGRPGDDSGDAPRGVKIIFDGYGLNEETDIEDDTNHLSFAVFVHQTSLTEEFPEHEQTPWALIHRPQEEVCIWAWYDCNEDQVTIVPFEDNHSTELDHNFVTKLIFEIRDRDNEQRN
jgi:hypothetical protein